MSYLLFNEIILLYINIYYIIKVLKYIVISVGNIGCVPTYLSIYYVWDQPQYIYSRIYPNIIVNTYSYLYYIQDSINSDLFIDVSFIILTQLQILKASIITPELFHIKKILNLRWRLQQCSDIASFSVLFLFLGFCLIPNKE